MVARVKVEFDTRELQRTLKKAADDVQRAAKGAINDTAFGFRKHVQAHMDNVLDRPTPYAKKAVYVLEKATDENLRAFVGVSDKFVNKQGKSHVDTLGHLFEGGQRNYKGLEGAMRRLKFLRGDYQCVPAKNSWAITLNAYGNVSSGFVTQIIAYFKGFGEQGYSANMTDKTRARREKLRGGRLDKRKGASRYRTINGVVYFAVPVGGSAGRWLNARFDQHLAPGIWAKRGIHGVDVAPVFLFVRSGQYKRYIDLQKLGDEYVPDAFDKALLRRLRAIGVAS